MEYKYQMQIGKVRTDNTIIPKVMKNITEEQFMLIQDLANIERDGELATVYKINDIIFTIAVLFKEKQES